MNFDPLRIAEWIIHQVELDQITDPAEAAQVKEHCLALAGTGMPEMYRFAERSALFWRGITRGNRRITAAIGNPEFNAPDWVRSTSEHHYHPALREFLVNAGVALDSTFAATPEEVAFVLAGGSLDDDEQVWFLRALYDRQHPFEGRDTTLNASDEGDHFTQSAGWVAAISDNTFIGYGCVLKVLRFMAFNKFGYDPDHYFAEAAHDQFGFVQSHRREPIIL
jgi:hypothetical protein